MKKYVIVLLLLGYLQVGHAQTWDEFFNQGTTQRKYLSEQILALKVYAGYLTKGYTIVRDGLQAIDWIKRGDFSLFDIFFSDMKRIRPAIKGSEKVQAIKQMLAECSVQWQRVLVQARQQSQPAELDYLQQVAAAAVQRCLTIRSDLELWMSDQTLALSDPERMERIDVLYERAEDEQMFSGRFVSRLQVLWLQRANEQKSIDHSRALNGIK